MAVNKNALIRYKVLDNCFRNPGKRYFIDDLVRECERVLLDIDSKSNGISTRQIFEDISFMESMEGWQIELSKLRDGKKVYYRYLDSSFSINNMPLNEVEINQLKATVDILSQFKGMPQFEWVNELLPKLKQGINSNGAETIIIEFDNNQFLKGIEHLGELYNAIYYEKVLRISYQPFMNELPSDIIHPYYLKQYNNRWFLFGFNPEKERFDWNLALDRIVNFVEVKGKYHKNNMIVWQEYFEDIIGVTKPLNKDAEIITIHFYGNAGKYIESKPLHGSQKSKWIKDNILEVNLQLIHNYELESVILSYGDSAKVLNPANLRSLISERIKRTFEQYK